MVLLEVQSHWRYGPMRGSGLGGVNFVLNRLFCLILGIFVLTAYLLGTSSRPLSYVGGKLLMLSVVPVSMVGHLGVSDTTGR